MIIIDFLRWYLTPNGVVVAEESGQISWFQAFLKFLSGAVKRYPDGPTDSDFVGYARLRMDVKRHKCKICKVHFWSWKKPRKGVCHKFSCYRRRNG